MARGSLPFSARSHFATKMVYTKAKDRKGTGASLARVTLSHRKESSQTLVHYRGLGRIGGCHRRANRKEIRYAKRFFFM